METLETYLEGNSDNSNLDDDNMEEIEEYASDLADTNSEDETFQRLTEQVRRRRRRRATGRELHAESDSYDGNENEEELDPVDLLRRLIRSRDIDDLREGFMDRFNGYSTRESTSSDVEHNREEEHEHYDQYDESRPLNSQDFTEVLQRIMGGGMMFGEMERENSEMRYLLNSLQQREDPYLLLETLNELSGKLLMMDGITAERMIPAGALAKSLIGIISDVTLSDHLEVKLVACRCLYNFLEVNQDFIHDALSNNAVEVLCEELMEIKYIDLTEQALQTLEMISNDLISHNRIVAADGLKACLNYLDFLTVHAQRKCLNIVSNSCMNISYANFPKIQEMFNNISEVVRNHSDLLVIERAWLAISRIIMSYKARPEFLDALFLDNEPLLSELVQVIYYSISKKTTGSSNNETLRNILNYGSCLSLIKSLVILAGLSINSSRILLENCDIGEIIIKSISKYSRLKAAPLSESGDDILNDSHERHIDLLSIDSIMEVPKELLTQFLNLIGYLLPIKVDDKTSAFLSFVEESNERLALNEKRATLYRDTIPSSYWKFINDVWPILIFGFASTMDYVIRKKALICLCRIVSFCDEKDLRKIKNFRFLVGLLGNLMNQSKTDLRKIFAGSNGTRIDEKEQDGEVEKAKVSTNSRAKSTESVNSKFILLEGLLITHILIEKFSSYFIFELEREGFFEDFFSIANYLESIELNDSEEPEQRNFASRSSMSSKYSDLELTGEFEFRVPDDVIIKDLVSKISEIKSSYFQARVDCQSVDEPSYLSRLKSVKHVLDSDLNKEFSYNRWAKLWDDLRKSFEGEANTSPLSSFELLSSGIIQSILETLKTNEVEKDILVNDRFKSFIQVFFTNSQSSGMEALAVERLITDLQNSLTRTENFDVITAYSSSILRNDSRSTASMARQIKLKLSLEDAGLDAPVQSIICNTIISVHAIATFKTIEGYIKGRIGLFEADHHHDLSTDPEADVKSNSDLKSLEPYEIEFLCKGEVVPNETTIYGAIYRSLQTQVDQYVDPSDIWSNIHEISFRKLSKKPPRDSIVNLYDQEGDSDEVESYDENTVDILKLLRLFFEMNTIVRNRGGNSVPGDKFLNWKLTVKLNRQLEEPLIVASGTLPGWCLYIPRNFSFLFPLETRMLLLQSTSFGYSRLINQWQLRKGQDTEGNNGSNSQRPQLGRPARQKVRLSRKLLLQSAIKVLDMYGTSPGILEIEYFDEVGSGLGPTLEFYSSVSKEFYKKKLKMWRDDVPQNSNGDSLVSSANGLIPRPMDAREASSENGKKILHLFYTLGKFIARALLDNRIVDINFNVYFLKLIQFLNKSKEDWKIQSAKISNMSNLETVDPQLAKSLVYLQNFSSIGEKSLSGMKLADKGAEKLEDLSLSFVLPGYPNFQIVPAGQDITVTSENVREYIDNVLQSTLCSGIIRQTRSFMEGFSSVFPISSLVIFSPQELVDLLGSAEEDWTYNTLSSSIQANHGYTKDSEAISRLLCILTNFTKVQRRSFLQFTTGAPKLPVGGFNALLPPFTVVRKHAETGFSDDDYLPSVMTCANYLKLPNYSSQEIMKTKLLQAMDEGAGSFHLS